MALATHDEERGESRGQTLSPEAGGGGVLLKKSLTKEFTFGVTLFLASCMLLSTLSSSKYTSTLSLVLKSNCLILTMFT